MPTATSVRAATNCASIERYIYGEICRSRPEAMAIVHSHSASVISFGVTRTKLRPI